MIIKEAKHDLGIEVCPCKADQKFQYYDPKSNTHKPADWIDKTPMWNKNHVLIYSGCCGSGKTTTSVSLLCSKRQRVYLGVFDQILICAPSTTLKSLANDPFESIPENQVFNEFNESFLDKALETAEYNSSQEKDTLLWIDDAANQLKSNKRVIDKLGNLVMKHRHLRCSIHLLCQDLIQIPLAIRENVSGVIVYRPVNAKRSRLFHEEYLGDLTYNEFMKLNEYIYRKKGDFLFIKMGNPREYYRNFNKLSFQGLDNEAASEKTEADCTVEEKPPPRAAAPSTE